MLLKDPCHWVGVISPGTIIYSPTAAANYAADVFDLAAPEIPFKRTGTVEEVWKSITYNTGNSYGFYCLWVRTYNNIMWDTGVWWAGLREKPFYRSRLLSASFCLRAPPSFPVPPSGSTPGARCTPGCSGRFQVRRKATLRGAIFQFFNNFFFSTHSKLTIG